MINLLTFWFNKNFFSKKGKFNLEIFFSVFSGRGALLVIWFGCRLILVGDEGFFYIFKGCICIGGGVFVIFRFLGFGCSF